MKIVDTITLAELRPMAERMYGTMVKADIDVAKKIVVIDMDMYVDGEAYLLERGSRQTDLWGLTCIQISLAPMSLSSLTA